MELGERGPGRWKRGHGETDASHHVPAVWGWTVVAIVTPNVEPSRRRELSALRHGHRHTLVPVHQVRGAVRRAVHSGHGAGGAQHPTQREDNGGPAGKSNHTW